MKDMSISKSSCSEVWGWGQVASWFGGQLVAEKQIGIQCAIRLFPQKKSSDYINKNVLTIH